MQIATFFVKVHDLYCQSFLSQPKKAIKLPMIAYSAYSGIKRMNVHPNASF